MLIQDRDIMMGVGDWFKEFCGNITVDTAATIAGRYKLITSRLNRDYWTTNSNTAHSLYVGSYGRNTAIRGFSDVDMIFELPPSLYHRYDGYYGNGQSALLQAVRNSIASTYPTTRVSGDGQVVLVPFLGTTFEVVPAFSNSSGSFTYPDSNNGGSWKTTDPKPEIAALRNRNSLTNGNLYQLCRMMRVWKAYQAVPMGGLHIDTLAYQFIANWEYRAKSYYYFDYMCRDFFAFLAAQSTSQTYWLAPGSSQYVYKRGAFQRKAAVCFELAKEAITHEVAKPSRTWSAKQKWRSIFGTKFPS